MENQIKGYNYEMQIKNYCSNQLDKVSFLWKDIPENILIQYGFAKSHEALRLNRKELALGENPLRDTGIDVLQIDDDKNCTLIQCKNGYKNGVTMKDLTGFFAWTSCLSNYNGIVYYTDKLSHNVRNLPTSDRIQYIKQPYIQSKKTKTITKIKAYDYQLEAVKKFNKHFTDNQRGILTMPCGTGKTYTSYLISKKYSQIIILSPLRQSSEQVLNKFIEYGYSGESLLVDSDGCRDKKEIKKFIKNNDKCLISATYCSVDIISKILKYTDAEDLLILVDEFHNLSKNNVLNEDDDFNEMLSETEEEDSDDEEESEEESDEKDSDDESDESIVMKKLKYKILFMSATPRVYELEENDNDYDMENLFGEIIYKMSFSEAIEKKYITDYKIWLPAIHEKNTALKNELSIYEIDSKIKDLLIYLYSCLTNNGSRKTIIYCRDINEVNSMMTGISTLNEFYCLDFNMHKITSETTQTNRNKILNTFETAGNIQLLFSVRICDESLDIIKCDSIFITYSSKSKLRTVQRMCRCLRNDINNKNKIGNIYLWCSEYEEIVETISSIKEYDVNYTTKIKINENNFYNNKTKSEIKTIEKNIEFVKDYIINIKKHKGYSWEDRLNMLKQYIDTNKKIPNVNDKNIKIHERNIGLWLANQKYDYKKNIKKMSISMYRNLWCKFIKKYDKYVMSYEDNWFYHMELVEQYITTHKCKPSTMSSDIDTKKLGKWIGKQASNFRLDKYKKQKDKYNRWKLFVNKYEKYVISNDKKWRDTLKSLENYILTNHRKPNTYKSDKHEKYLGEWIASQIKNFKNTEYIMKNEDCHVMWCNFTHKYKEYFITNIERWCDKLALLKKYINEHDEFPTYHNKTSSSIRDWYAGQNRNYKNNEGLVVKNKTIRNKWLLFLDEYQEYL